MICCVEWAILTLLNETLSEIPLVHKGFMIFEKFSINIAHEIMVLGEKHIVIDLGDRGIADSNLKADTVFCPIAKTIYSLLA